MEKEGLDEDVENASQVATEVLVEEAPSTTKNSSGEGVVEEELPQRLAYCRYCRPVFYAKCIF